jgi:hypothetical protein
METDKAPLAGQADTPDQAAGKAIAESSQNSPFFEDVSPDGTKKVYATRDDLAREWKSSYLRQSDYTRKTQEIAQARKQHEEEIRKFQEDQKAFLDNRKRYDEWDKLLKQRPDIYQQLEKAASSPPDAYTAFERSREYADGAKQELAGRIEALEKRLEEENTKKELDSEIQALKGKYPDFNEPEIMSRLEYISDGSTAKLLELLYHAYKGQTSPAQVEEKITQNLQKKSQARMVPAKGAGPSTPRRYSSLDEAKNAAYEDEGIAPGPI